jgi:hypothetical protein
MLKKYTIFLMSILLVLMTSGCGTLKGMGKGFACVAQGVGDGIVNLWRTATKSNKLDGGPVKGIEDGAKSVTNGVGEDVENIVVNPAKKTGGAVIKADEWFKKNLW